MTALEIKSLSIENKIEYFRKLFSDLDNENELDIINVFRIINTYNTFDDNFFEDTSVYISDISELIDIKIALESEIKNLSTELTKWYFGALMSCDIRTSDNSENEVMMPALIRGLLSNITIPAMSAIIKNSNIEQIKLTELPVVKDSFSIISKLMQCHSFVASCFDII